MTIRSSSFGGGDGPVAAIVNAYSAGGSQSSNAINSVQGAAVYSSGATTAGTLKTLLSVTGRGRVNVLTLARANSTSKTITLKVTLDGRVVFAATSSTSTSVGTGLVAVGFPTTNSAWFAPQPVNFTTSMLVEATTSVSETDGVTLHANYEVWA